MADQDRTPAHLVEFFDRIERETYKYDFYQVIRVLDAAAVDKPPTGCSDRPRDDVARFGQEVTMAFAPATLSRVHQPHEGGPKRYLQRFFGLFGPNGPLPVHLTEYAKNRIRDRRDDTFNRFVDIFHHRMISLFYRAWARVRPSVSFDKPDSDRFGDYVGSLFGLGMGPLCNRDALPDLPKRHFSGLLSCQTKNAEGLLALLSGYFGFPVQIQEFVGQWVELPPGSQCLTGASSSDLGMTTTVGSHIWDRQQKFRIIIGPLTLEEYNRMLPGGVSDGEDPGRRESLDAMVAAVRTYAGDEIDWDLQLILKKEEVPPVAFGEQGQLGWTSWMPEEEIEEDPDDLILRPMERVFV